MNADRLPVLLVAGLSLAYAACGGDNLTLPSEGEPASITVLSGNEQTGRVASPLGAPLVVVVKDNRDLPVAGATVQFAIDNPATGTAAPAQDTTDANGEASSSITLGSQVGPVTGHATVPMPEGTTPVNAAFTATAVSDNANGITMVSGDGQSGQVGSALPDPLVVQVTDRFGNPIAGIDVQWSVTGGGGLSEQSTRTGESGQTSVTRVLGTTAGQQTTVASAAGLVGSPITFTHTAIAGNASRVVIISGNNQQGPPGAQLANPLVVEVLDAESNPIVGSPVAWVIGTGEGTANPQTSTTDAQGRASTQWTLGPAPGRNTLSAVVSGVGVAAFTATATTTASRTQITSDQPDPSTVGQTVHVQFTVTGEGGTPTGNVTVTVNGGSESCSGLVATGFCDIVLNSPGNRELTATYAGDSRFSGSLDHTDHRVDAQNNAPTAAFNPPSCTAGTPCQFTDGSSDSDGNVVAWTWDFGDGQPASDQKNPVHTYLAPNTYNVKLTVRDDDGATSEVTHQVTVAAPPPTNMPPVAAPETYSTPTGQALSVDAPGVLANDTDPDGDTLTAELLTQPSNGLVVLNPNGSFTYFPGSAAAGTQETFTYNASDGTLTSTATVTIAIQ